MTHFDAEREVLRVLVADDGMGIRESLAENDRFRNITEEEAVRLCLEDSVTDGKGMGFGLYATSRLMKDVGLQFVIHSGHHKLVSKDGVTETVENGLWQGTIVYMEISTNEESNSFSDECIAKLLLEMPLEKLKQLTTFRNLTPMAERSILVALQRRYKMQ